MSSHNDEQYYEEQNPQFIVMCRVSGGVTGTREAILKRDGIEQYFDSREVAQAEATRLNAKMNHAFSVADFRYWVEER